MIPFSESAQDGYFGSWNCSQAFLVGLEVTSAEVGELKNFRNTDRANVAEDIFLTDG